MRKPLSWVSMRTVGFAPMQARTLKDNIVDLLTDAIISGKMKPGDRLNESHLARELRVSRAPIREALHQLEEQGLVVNNPRRGMFVVSLEEEDLQKINSLRLVLEAEALALARANLTPQAEKKLAQLVEKMEQMRETPVLQAVKLDMEFHRTIWSLTGSEYLQKILLSLTAPLFAHAILTRPKAERMRMVLDSHRPMLEYLVGKSSQSPEDIILAHLSLRWPDPDKYSAHRLRK